MHADTFTGPDGQRYDIRIHDAGEAQTTPAPVIWLLDAPTIWPPMHEALDACASAATVVAIDWHGDGPVDRRLRFRDFTPPPQQPDADPDAADAGGAAAFRAFLIDELRPALAARLPGNATRHCLFGHSLSGLFVLDTWLTQPDAFDCYVALSPSLWWDDAALLARVRSADLRPHHATRVHLRAGMGEQTAGPEKPAEVDGPSEAAMLGARHMVANLQAFAQVLEARGIASDHDVLPDVGHHAMLAAALPDALRFALAP